MGRGGNEWKVRFGEILKEVFVTYELKYEAFADEII